jgi:hypothetical protein
VADLLAKEVKEFDFYLMQTRDQVPDLTVDRHTDALDPVQYVKHPPQSRTARRWVDVMRDRVVLTGSCAAQTALRHGIDQQRQGHHHQ